MKSFLSKSLGHILLSLKIGPLLRKIQRLTAPEDMVQRANLYRQILAIVRRDDDPPLWAELLGKLGDSLAQCVGDDRAMYIEQAIAAYEQALEVFTLPQFAYEWASVQANLGRAYVIRPHGDQSENLERAITYIRAAMQVMTPQYNLEDWLGLQIFLGVILQRSRQGSPVDNLEAAIDCFQRALAACPPRLAERRASAHINLAMVYRQRIRGEQAENIEQAIYHLNQVQTFCTPQSNLRVWAGVQQNLAIIYWDRIRGERHHNLDQAVQFCERAQRAFTHLNAFRELASLNLTLAHILLDHSPRDNWSKILSLCEQALSIYNHVDDPDDWALGHVMLGLAYAEQPCDKPDRQWDRALFHYRQALTVYNRQSFPVRWAITTKNIGDVYLEQDTPDSLAAVATFFTQALEVLTPQSDPRQCREIAYVLGRIYYGQRRWAEAKTALSLAHQAIHLLHTETSRIMAKQALAEENVEIYKMLVACCIHTGCIEEAFSYTLLAKGRVFVDTISSTRFDLGNTAAANPQFAADLAHVQQLQQQIDILTTLIDRGTPSSTALILNAAPASFLPRELNARLKQLRAQAAALWEDLAYRYPALTATQQVPQISPAHIQDLARTLDATLVEYYWHAESWCAFVITADTLLYIPLPLVNHSLLKRMWDSLQWMDLPIGRSPISIKLLEVWHEAVFKELKPYLQPDRQVVLAPFGPLHVLPITAARDAESGHYAGDEYTLVFSPSLSMLHVVVQQAQQRPTRPDTLQHAQLLNVAYPGMPDRAHYLADVLPEAYAIEKQFSRTTPLYESAATPDAVIAHAPHHQIIHFGCHAQLTLDQLLYSGLWLYGGWLTVQRIITEINLAETQLVTLGACDTGGSKIRQSDDYMGLVHAMFVAGAPTVVASLWAADDAATRLLFETFYQQIAMGDSPATALSKAKRQIRANPAWEHPYFWANFQIYGLTGVLASDTSQPDVSIGARPVATTSIEQQEAPIPSFFLKPEEVILFLEFIQDFKSEITAMLTPSERRVMRLRLREILAHVAMRPSPVELAAIVTLIHNLVNKEVPALNALLLPCEIQRPRPG